MDRDLFFNIREDKIKPSRIINKLLKEYYDGKNMSNM